MNLRFSGQPKTRLVAKLSRHRRIGCKKADNSRSDNFVTLKFTGVVVMKKKLPKKTLAGGTAHTMMRGAKVEGGKIIVEDRAGIRYAARSYAPGVMAIAAEDGAWSGLLTLTEWAEAELKWHEAQIEKLTAPQHLFLVLVDGVVVGHLLKPFVGLPDALLHPFRLNNVALQPPPALGQPYTVPIEPQRPPRVRGPSKDIE